MTTAQEIEKLLHDHRAWLKDRTTLREVNSTWVEITTPYLGWYVFQRGESSARRGFIDLDRLNNRVYSNLHDHGRLYPRILAQGAKD